MINKYNVDENNTKFNFNNLKRIMPYLGNYKKEMTLVFLLNCLVIIMDLLVVKILEVTINIVIPSKDIPALIGLVFINLIIIALTVVSNIVLRRKLAFTTYGIMTELKNDLFSHMQYLSTDYYDTRPNGKILLRLTTYVDDVTDMITNNLVKLVVSFLNIAFVLVFMFLTNVTLTFYSLIGVVAVFVVFFITVPIKRRKMQEVNNKNANLNAYAVESVKGVNITQAFNREKENDKIFSSLSEKVYESNLAAVPYWNITWYTTWNASFIMEMLMYVIGFMYLSPNVAIGTIIAMASYTAQFWRPLRRVFDNMDAFTSGFTYLERILELRDEPIRIVNSENPKRFKIKGEIEFKDVDFGYIEERLILKDINFKINPNEKVALVGSTGSGKTTIVSLLERFYDINQGEILIDGVNIKDIDLKTLRTSVTIMIQDNYLFSNSILENIRYGNKKVTKKQVIKVCKDLRLHDFIMSLEKGYDTVLNNNAKEISDGERQLLSYARTIIADPEIIILDEATSKIDLKTEKLIGDSLKKYFKNKTIITIAHRLSTIVDADKIILLKEGRIIEMGTHKELMKKKEDYYKLFSSQNKLI